MGIQADEPAHVRYVSWISKGIDFFPRLLPYFPGYHYTLAALYWLTHFHPPTPAEFEPLCSPKALYFFPTVIRLLSTLLSYICLIGFFTLAKTINKDTAIRKSSLFLFFPIFFPFFFIIYTDIYSMFYVFLCLLFALKRRFWLSGLFGILSCLVRQNNILWVIFVGWVAYFESYYPQWRWKDVKLWISKFYVYFIDVILFIAFVIWNKGLVIGDRSHHSMALRLENSFYLLFFFFFIFLPYNFSKAGKISDFLKKNKLMWLLLIEVFLLYVFFFKATHMYNSTRGIFHLFLHNHVTALMKNTAPLSRILTFLPIAYSILVLCVTRLERKSFYLLYPFTILFLLPNAVVEIRYIFIPLALFLLFKEKDSWKMTTTTLAFYWVALCFFIPAMAKFFM
jgi:alpha-1,2-glucosyltransferase